MCGDKTNTMKRCLKFMFMITVKVAFLVELILLSPMIEGVGGQ